MCEYADAPSEDIGAILYEAFDFFEVSSSSSHIAFSGCAVYVVVSECLMFLQSRGNCSVMYCALTLPDVV